MRQRITTTAMTTIQNNINLFSPIINLNFISRPSAIRPAVMPIIINSVDSSLFFSEFFNMLEIGLIHVISEFFKRAPEKFYTPTSIVVVKSSLRRIAPTPRSEKYIIESLSRLTSYRKTMCSRIFPYKFTATHTAARTSVMSPEIRTWLYTFVSTIALTQKQVAASFISTVEFFYQQFTEFLSNQIYTSHFNEPKKDTRFASGYPFLAAKLITL